MQKMFYVETCIFDEIKKAIRKFSSLYFLYNPIEFNEQIRIGIEGTVEDMNSFDILREKIEYYGGKHKEDCLWLDPLATGEGTWGCTCGRNNFLIENGLE